MSSIHSDDFSFSQSGLSVVIFPHSLEVGGILFASVFRCLFTESLRISCKVFAPSFVGRIHVGLHDFLVVVERGAIVDDFLVVVERGAIVDDFLVVVERGAIVDKRRAREKGELTLCADGCGDKRSSKATPKLGVPAESTSAGSAV
jgi:hypothetical protein